MQERFTNDEKTIDKQNLNHPVPDSTSDSDKFSSVKGFKKLSIIIILFAFLLFFKTQIFDVVTVIGPSMEETFKEDDVLLVKKINTTVIERYSIVIAKSGGKNVIKRVIGLPGDTVQIIDGNTFVNGEPVLECFDFFTADSGVAKDAYILEDKYFLMGDNRQESEDSRVYGGVKKEDIKGTVIVRLFPFSKAGKIGNEDGKN